MKKILFTFLILITSISYAQDVNGIWSDSSNTAFKNCWAIISVESDSVFMTHYVEFNGHPFVEHGEGIIKNNKLSYHVVVTKQIPDWKSKSGEHTLTLSPDGNTLRGFYKDNLGNIGPLVFKRKFPHKK